jgi:preprotein translocase subunit YajC
VEFLIFIVFGFLLMWLFVVVPQRRRVAAHERMVETLKPGDEVVTAGGLYGDVTEVGDDEVALEIAPGVEVRVAMRAIGAVVPPDAYDDEDEDTRAADADEDAVDADRTSDETAEERPAAGSVDGDRR